MSDEHEPRRAFPAQTVHMWTAQDLNRWHAEDEQYGAEEWPLPISGDGTAWAAGGDLTAWEAMACTPHPWS